jgi:4a-hydroxytetrahydrobiopterin dehydratase
VATLAGQKCKPCQGGTPPLGTDAQALLHEQLHPDWKVVNGHHLSRTFQFPDFVTALDFVNRLGAIAEEEGHHPDLLLKWGSVKADVWTHKIDGLTESDFILAAKADVTSLAS